VAERSAWSRARGRVDLTFPIPPPTLEGWFQSRFNPSEYAVEYVVGVVYEGQEAEFEGTLVVVPVSAIDYSH
jgi:hypothetical protein